MVKDLNPGSAFYNGVGWLIGVNGTLYFAADPTAPERGRAVAKRRHRGGHDLGQGGP